MLFLLLRLFFVDAVVADGVAVAVAVAVVVAAVAFVAVAAAVAVVAIATVGCCFGCRYWLLLLAVVQMLLSVVAIG